MGMNGKVWGGGGLIVGFLLGTLAGAPFFFSPNSLLAGVLKSWSGEELAAEIDLNSEKFRQNQEEASFEDKDFLQKESEIGTFDQPVQKRDTTAVFLEGGSQPTSVVFNINLEGATVELKTDRVVLDSSQVATVTQAGEVETSGKCVMNDLKIPNQRGIYLSEVAWMGTSVSVSDEWIELKNVTRDEIDLSGWELKNKDGRLDIVFKEGEKMREREIILLERSDDETVQAIKASVIYTGALGNEDEALYLFDASCNLVDKVEARGGWPAGDSKTKQTMERDWVTTGWKNSDLPGGTPGADNGVAPLVIERIALINSDEAAESADGKKEEEKLGELAPPGAVSFSEIQAGTSVSGSDEFIELFNGGEVEIDLTGWSIKKRTANGNESTLVAASRLEGKKILVGKHLLFVNEGGYAGVVEPDGNWATSNTIAYTNNALILYNAEGEVAAEVHFEEIPKDKSYEKTDSGWQIREIPQPENSSS